MSSVPDLLFTQRVRVRKAHVEDAVALYEAASTPGFLRWMSWSEPASLRAIERHLLLQRQAWEEGKGYCFTATSRADEGVLGGVHLKPDSFDTSPRTWNLGYWTHPRFQRRGYASEFVPVVIEWAFEVLRARQLIAGVAVENEPSHRVLRRLGFRPFEQRAVCTAEKRFPNVRYRLVAPSCETSVPDTRSASFEIGAHDPKMTDSLSKASVTRDAKQGG